MSIILVTGATGFIGSHLTDALCQRGDEVRCLLRGTSNPRWLPASGFKIFRGDLLSGQGLDAALAGVEAVFHLAGATKARNAAEFRLHNVQATRMLLQAVRRAAPQIKRFVFLSSQAAAGPSPGDRARDEDCACAPVTPYGQSKLDAEAVCREFPELPWVVLRAVSVYGPRDRDFLVLIKSIQRGIAPVLGSSQKQLTFVHVADVVQALLLAAADARAVQQTYFITDGHIYTWPETKSLLEQALGKRARSLRIPLPVVWLLAALADGWSRATGIPTIFNLSRVRELSQPNWGCSCAKLQKELGFTPRYPLATGLRQTIAWAKSQGWL